MIILTPSQLANMEEHRHKIPMPIPLFVVNTVEYQCGRLLKHNKTTNKIGNSTGVCQTSLQSIQGA